MNNKDSCISNSIKNEVVNRFSTRLPDNEQVDQEHQLDADNMQDNIANTESNVTDTQEKLIEEPRVVEILTGEGKFEWVVFEIH